MRLPFRLFMLMSSSRPHRLESLVYPLVAKMYDTGRDTSYGHGDEL